jgi:hypothetical protein
MSQVCIALLLATALAAPAAEPVAAEPVVAPAAEAAAAPVVAPVAAPASGPVVAPVTAPATAPVVAPATAPAPVAQPAPVAAPTVILAPAPASAPAPAAPTTTAPPPPRFDPELARAQRSADGLAIGGAVALGLGGASLVLVSWPAYAFYKNSLERAESVRWVPEQDRFIDEARRRRSVMLISAGIGAGLTAVGTVLVATGLSRRARLRNATAATLSVAPAVGGGSYGVAASMRF